MFIDDVYNDRRIVADGVFPSDLLDDSANYRPECQGFSPKFGVWAHISGSDLVRAGDGDFYVLEDNVRVPSGISYVLENRGVAKRTFPELFERQRVRPVDGYTDELNKLLSSLAPDDIANAPGAGVADDKCVYAWVPDMIRYSLDDEPLIKNVPTYRCMYQDERDDRLDVFGNRVVQLGIHRPHRRLVVAVSTQVEITSAMTPRVNPAWNGQLRRLLRGAAGISKPPPPPARKRQSAPTHRMRGVRCGYPSMGGSTLTRLMASSALTDM
jgi:uncharacterized circularly permuted ATP-grasp superfamily protein